MPLGCVATIGVFDGVHLGHQQILARVRSKASLLRVASLVFSFEPTPQEVMNPLKPPARLTRLREMGLSISVDDFGTGYSSLGHLKHLPIDKLKIDRSFIRDLPDARDSVAIASAIIQMGRSLGMTVIAEGVETAEQGEFLAAQGCDELQGYLISPALPRNTSSMPASTPALPTRAPGTLSARSSSMPTFSTRPR